MLQQPLQAPVRTAKVVQSQTSETGILKIGVGPALHAIVKTSSGAADQIGEKRGDPVLHGIVDVGSKVLITDRLAVFVVGAEKKIGGVDDVQKPTPVFGDPVPGILGMREQAAASFESTALKLPVCPSKRWSVAQAEDQRQAPVSLT